jgi:hypothetical protein
MTKKKRHNQQNVISSLPDFFHNFLRTYTVYISQFQLWGLYLAATINLRQSMFGLMMTFPVEIYCRKINVNKIYIYYCTWRKYIVKQSAVYLRLH